MKTLKTITTILLGIGTMLAFNENIEALWLNAIGIGCLWALLGINPDAIAKK